MNFDVERSKGVQYNNSFGVIMMRQMKVSFFAIVFLLAGMASACLLAQEAEHPCKRDAEKYCRDVEPGQGRLQKCLRKHDDEISQGCRDKLKEAKKEIKLLKKACKKDKKLFCKDVEDSERGSIVNCLMKNEKDLSPECKEACKARF